VVADNGPPVHWTSICWGSWGSMSSMSAVGYFFSGGPPPGTHALDVDGCENDGDLVASPGISLSATNATSAGTFAAGLAHWTDALGATWGVPGDPFKMTVTSIGPIGGYIDGTFDVVVSHGGSAAHSLAGSFHVCRVPDELAP
jgi:hypothetical protein